MLKQKRVSCFHNGQSSPKPRHGHSTDNGIDTATAMEDPGKEQGYVKVLSPSRLVFGLWGISLASSCYHSTRAPVRPAPSLEAPAALKCVRHLTLAIYRSQSSSPTGGHQNTTLFLSPTVPLKCSHRKTGSLIHCW